MNLSAVQHFAFDNFCYQLDNDTLEINILTGKDVEKLFITAQDPFTGGIMGGNFKYGGTEQEITKKIELQNHFKWTITVKPQFKRLSYFFRLCGQNEEYIYSYNGFYTKEEFENGGNRHGLFTYPWMNPVDTPEVPQWAENTVWYQIFPARFAKGRWNWNDERLIPWGKYGESVPHGPGIHEPVYGGNLQGIIDRLDYLKDLGITGIYTTPLNLSSSQHKYNTDDYLKIDPEFGNEKLMKRFVSEAHKRGIRVMLDGVFNHSGWDWPIWQDVWKKRENSKYKNWFMVNDFNFTEPSWGYGKGNAGTGKYYSFAFVDFMPKLNTNNPEVRRYFINVCRTWVKKYDIDGLRLDVANEISHVFCQELHDAMISLKKDFYIVGEIWHNSQPWLRGREFHSVMNYPLQNGIADFLSNKNWSVKQLEYALNRCYSMYYRQNNHVLFNQMDSHDTIRILNRFEMNRKAAEQSLVLLFCMSGSVCIYYGTEILLEGSYDPDNRRCMPWKEIDEGRFNSQIDFTKKLISLRKNHSAMRSVETEFIYDENDKDGKSRIIHLVKESEDGSEKLELLMNSSENPCDLKKYAQGKNVLLERDGILLLSL